MALLSPGIQTNEIDLSVVASNAGSTNAAFGGRFERGYAGKAVNINSVSELISNFGKPSNENFNQWFQCYYFLQYSNGLYVSRAVDENGHWIEEETPNEVEIVTNLGKVQVKGNPTNLYVGDVVKFAEDSEDEYKITAIELPQEGVKAKQEILIKQGGTADYVVTINGTRFEFKSTSNDKNLIAQGLSQKIDLPGVATDTAQNERIIVEMVNPGEELTIEVNDENLMDVGVLAEPLPVEGYELVFDEETDFTDIAKAGSKIFKKAFSVNAFKFAPRDNKDDYVEVEKDGEKVQESPLKVLDATGQIPFQALYLNEDDYDVKEGSITFPEKYVLKFMARGFGAYGNKIQVAIAREKDFNDSTSQIVPGLALAGQFEYKSLDSNKEVSLIILENGLIVERFQVSLDPNAKDYQGRSLFVEDVIRRKSSYIYAKVNQAETSLPLSALGENVITLSNGDDGEIGKSEIENSYGNVSDGAIFGDVESLPLDYIISNEESRTIAGKLAVARGDCIAYHGAKFDIVGQTSTKIVELLLEDVNNGEMNSGDTRNSYNAYFGNYAMIWDTYNDKYRWINIAGMVAGARAKTSYDLYPWYASAGEAQGQLTGIVKLAFLPNTGARDKLYTSQVNPVTSFPGRGIQIYGQKTLQAKNSAFSRINVRLLFNYVKRNLSELVRSYIFELNDEFTRNNIKAQIDAFMLRIQTLRGVYDYLTICDESNNTGQVIDNNELVIDLGIKPTRVAEFIYLNLMAVGSDVSLSEVMGGAQ